MWTTKKIAEALEQSTNQDISVSGFEFNSQDVQPSNCFLALKGDQIDGNDFIEDARKKGAVCVIGQKNADFIVPNTYTALNQLALYARNHSPAKRIAITGSVGKTTTVSFLSQLLGQNHKIVSPKGTFNNHIGVPITMTKLDESTEFGIFEIGMNHIGETRPLAELVKPDIAIITKIGNAHIGYMGSQLAIAEEKAQILHALTPDGIGIVPEDEFLEVYQKAGRELIVVPQAVNTLESIPQRLQNNFAMVLEVLSILGVKDYNREKLSIPAGRGNTVAKKISGKNVTIIDDAYNAAFDAFLGALNDLAKLPGRKIIVVGDMGEVDGFEDEFHNKVAQLIRSLPNLGAVFAVSPMIAKALGVEMHRHDEVLRQLHQITQNNDLLYFKGSKKSRVSAIVKGI